MNVSLRQAESVKGHEFISQSVQSVSRVQLFVTPWTVAHQAPLSTGFPRQEYWSGLPLPSPGDLPDPRTEPTSLESSVTCITTSTLFNLCVSLSDHTLFKVLSM